MFRARIHTEKGFSAMLKRENFAHEGGCCVDRVISDHTPEVERRLAAIRVKSRDCCSFFKSRDGCLVNLRECWYCVFGDFDKEGKGLPTQGYCKCKK